MLPEDSYWCKVVHLMKSYEDLEAWQRAMDLVEEVYSLTKKLPREELYGLSAQLNNASRSVPANIAEGFGRYTFADKAHKYIIARGECTEVECHIKSALRSNILSTSDCTRAFVLTDRVGRLLSGLIKSCKNRS
jgi:four helix bundle protein